MDDGNNRKLFSQDFYTDEKYGLGWGVEYVCRLLKYYPHFTEDYILYHLPMKRGWIYISFAMENDGWLNFCGLQRHGPGYVEKQINEMISEYKESLKKKE